MFQGFIEEGVGGTLLLSILSAGAPTEPDAAPTFRIYGANGVVAAGTGSASSFETGSVTGASNAAPVVITSAAHGLSVGQRVTVSGVGGNAGANGTFTVTAADANTFTLGGSTGTGAYTSGGTWRSTGLYAVTLSGTVLSGLQAGKTYTCVVHYALSAVAKSAQTTFTVR